MFARWDRFQLWKLRLLERLEIMRCEGVIALDRTVRFHVPVGFRGSRGHVEVFSGTSFGHSLVSRWGGIMIQARNPHATVKIGMNCHFSNRISIIANERIEIGNNLLCGEDVVIIDSDFHPVAPEDRHAGCGKVMPVKIGDNVWLGDGVMVLKGVEIGDGSVVAARSVVTKSIPPRSLAMGCPVKVEKAL